MSADSPEEPPEDLWPEDPREELRTIDEEMSDLRATATSLREQVGEDEDPTDRAALIEAAEEQEQLIGELEARRSELLRRLGES